MYNNLYLILRAITTQIIESSRRAWWSHTLVVKYRAIKQMGIQTRLPTNKTEKAVLKFTLVENP